MLSRQQILQSLQHTFEPLPYFQAMWEAGAVSWGRVDDWSDIDLQFDVDDDRIEDAVTAFEAALTALSPLDLKYEVPQPTYHGHFQAFYRLRDTSPYLLLDVVIMQHSNANKFLEREIHGEAVVYFDKSGVVQPPLFDAGAWQAKLKDYLVTLRIKFDLFQVFVLKEIPRRHPVEALVYYQGSTLRPLVEALGIRYRPTRYNFHTRYVYDEFPAEIVQKLESLFFVKDMDDLLAKHAAAVNWFYQILEELEP